MPVVDFDDVGSGDFQVVAYQYYEIFDKGCVGSETDFIVVEQGHFVSCSYSCCVLTAGEVQLVSVPALFGSGGIELGDCGEVGFVEYVGDCGEGAIKIILQRVERASLKIRAIVIIHHLVDGKLSLIKFVFVFVPERIGDFEVAIGFDFAVEGSFEGGLIYKGALLQQREYWIKGVGDGKQKCEAEECVVCHDCLNAIEKFSWNLCG